MTGNSGSSSNNNRLTEYRFEEIRNDFVALNLKLDRLEQTLQRFGERIGKTESAVNVNKSRVDMLYWLIPVAITFTGTVVGIVVYLM